jgi:hypothetical protein
MFAGHGYFTFKQEGVPAYFDVLLQLPLWSSGQSSWLQIQRSGLDSRRDQIFWEVNLERGPLSLVSTIEELLGRKSSCSSLEIREYGRRDPSRWSRTPSIRKSWHWLRRTIGGRSVGIVRSRIQAKVFSMTKMNKRTGREKPISWSPRSPNISWVPVWEHNAHVNSELLQRLGKAVSRRGGERIRQQSDYGIDIHWATCRTRIKTVLQTTWRWPPIRAETCSVRSAQ